jgi:hypothetical protein
MCSFGGKRTRDSEPGRRYDPDPSDTDKEARGDPGLNGGRCLTESAWQRGQLSDHQNRGEPANHEPGESGRCQFDDRVALLGWIR